MDLDELVERLLRVRREQGNMRVVIRTRVARKRIRQVDAHTAKNTTYHAKQGETYLEIASGIL